MKQRAFTLVELLVAIAIIALVVGLAVPAFGLFKQTASLKATAAEIMSGVRLAQQKTVASEGAFRYGVFFNTTPPHSYTLFEGNDYASRNAARDEVRQLPSSVEFSAIALAGESSFLVFDRITGSTLQPGTVTVRLQADGATTATVSVSSAGDVILGQEVVGSLPNPVQDSRHVRVDYVGRAINTAAETMRLDFGATEYVIVLANSMSNGQIDWTGSVLVDGEEQQFRVHTLLLNDAVAGTRFSFHRDKRYNTKALQVFLSGDATGDVIWYTGAGETTQGTSLYVSLPEWQ